ncbi:MAG: hypothetical protein ABGX24_06800 [Aquificota bacterium]
MKAKMLDKVNEAINLVDQIINAIPKPLRDYFEEREVQLMQPFNQIDLIANIINNPDKFSNIKECLNFSQEIACTQKLKRAVCYMAGFMGAVEGFLGTPLKSKDSMNDFLQDWNKRLGATALTGNSFGQAINALKPIFDICKMSTENIKNLYQKMRDTEKEISSSIADQLANQPGCNGVSEVVPNDKISVECESDGKVKIEETISGKICTIDNIIGLRVNVIGMVLKRGSGYEEGYLYTDGSTADNNIIYIGETTSSEPLQFKVNLWTKIDCKEEKDIRECVQKNYINKVSWVFVKLEREPEGSSVEYRVINNAICGTGACSSDALSRSAYNNNLVSYSDSCNVNKKEEEKGNTIQKQLNKND